MSRDKKETNHSFLKENFKSLLMLFLFSLVIFVILSIDPRNILLSGLKVGSVSDFDIKAPEAITYVTGSNLFLEKLDSIFSLLSDYLKLPDKIKKKNLDNLVIILKNQLEQNLGVTFPNEEIKLVLFLSERELNKWKDIMKKLISHYSSGVSQEDLLKAQRKVVMEIVKRSEKETPFFVKIIGYLSRFIPQKKKIKKGEYVVRKGEILSSEQILLLKKLKLFERKKKFNFLSLIGKFLLICWLSFLMFLYMKAYHPQIISEEKLFMMVWILFSIFLVIAKVFYFLNFIKNVTFTISHYKIEVFSPFFLPISSFSIIFTILFDLNLAFLMTVMMSLIVGFIYTPFSFIYILYVLVSGWVSALVISDFRERGQIAKAGSLSSISNVLMILLLFFLFPSFFEKRIVLLDIGWGALAGIVSAVMAIGGLPFLEKMFNITTSLKMLELIDFSQPLLQRLILDAPGTYHHSVIVSNLAEAAAREIGANPLICKAGGYYHDIGKLKRPYFFVENQTGENAHDQLNPNLSALVIISHVKDGVALAKEYSLPKSIIDIIKEHHGTSLVSYFYDKATREGANGSELEMKFRYPGPKPQTKESAIVMLADSIESAGRTLKKPGATQIKNLVSRIINQKFEDGQLDDSNLTMKDLEKLEHVFSRILISMYHARIEYPDEINRIITQSKTKDKNKKEK